MRIIDKNNDFYDFYQDIFRDDTIVFDRSDSFELTKDMVYRHLDFLNNNRYFNKYFYKNPHHYNFLLLQVCNTFWLFCIEYNEKNYTIDLITTWKNYNKPRKLIALEFVSHITRSSWDYKKSIYEMTLPFPQKTIDDMKMFIDNNEHKVEINLCHHQFYHNNEFHQRHIPLLKSCGIASLIDAQDIYLAFEEYFSYEKTANERCESVNLTNDEKITNHGFDTKYSFRGK